MQRFFFLFLDGGVVMGTLGRRSVSGVDFRRGFPNMLCTVYYSKLQLGLSAGVKESSRLWS